MPRSKTFLPDVNVWVALVFDRHVHARVASAWLDSVIDDEVVFCRVTQMGLLRLATNTRVMGADVLTQTEAWRLYRRIASDERIRFVPEPQEIESAWHELTTLRSFTPCLWTGAYLQAFARQSGAQVVSFDRDISRLGGPAALILRP